MCRLFEHIYKTTYSILKIIVCVHHAQGRSECFVDYVLYISQALCVPSFFSIRELCTKIHATCTLVLLEILLLFLLALLSKISLEI